MFLGLFQYTINSAIKDSIAKSNLSLSDAVVVDQQLEPVRQFSIASGFFFTSVFVIYFTLFKASTFRRNLLLLLARFLVVVVYCPLLFYFGCHLDGSFILLTIFARLLYVCYYAWRYKSIQFVVLNTTTLAFVNGKCTYYANEPFFTFEGGDHYIKLGEYYVPFVDRNSLYVALRGKFEEDVYLSRSIELFNGHFLYVFTRQQVVGIVNSNFTDVQLDELEYASAS
ncbi:non-structural protein 3 [Bat coronavirus CDPHE15/USA/2006]|uniref:Non-structural protein 3 n=1 Tax=Bat coronavirus CDPHE15 TaxID=1913643 RepID=S5ZIX9_9ALPC|nr:non-structural protein 3 [Bat coronavirus CDPHE15/USA/2006]AGT21334.1 non-structural protein 3 [Bat coronavirus CDPHE15/USA/2006]